jgi:hypothetical protein
MHAVFESMPVLLEKRDSAAALHALQHVEGHQQQLELGKGRVGFWKKHGAGLFGLFAITLLGLWLWTAGFLIVPWTLTTCMSPRCRQQGTPPWILLHLSD